MASVWSPAASEEEEELFKQQIEQGKAPVVAKQEKGFLAKVAPMATKLVVDSFAPGLGDIAAGVVSASTGGDAEQLASPETAEGATKWYSSFKDKKQGEADAVVNTQENNLQSMLGAGDNSAATMAKSAEEEELMKKIMGAASAPLSYKGGVM